MNVVVSLQSNWTKLKSKGVGQSTPRLSDRKESVSLPQARRKRNRTEVAKVHEPNAPLPKKRKKQLSRKSDGQEAACLSDKLVWFHLTGENVSEIWDSREPSPGVSKLAGFCRVSHTQSSPAAEAAAVQAVQQLGVAFQEFCGRILGGRKWFAHFEQWLWSVRQPSSVVPVLPLMTTDTELKRKLLRTGCDAARVRKIFLDLQAKCEALRIPQCPVEGHVVLTRTAATVSLEYTGVVVECSAAHWEKLRQLHVRSSKSQKFLRNDAFCVLARLHALQGANPRSGGMQAALHGEVFDSLYNDFACLVECFASPLNCRWSHFCSAAADVDGPFGSLGSFYDFWPEEGSYQANPPFEPAVVATMAGHIDQLLHRAEECQKPLSFVVVIPSWPDEASWRSLQTSPFCTANVHLPQRLHGFCEGGQHYRASRYRRSNHDSTVFILQTAAGKRAWPPTAQKLRRLEGAFRPKDSLTST